MTIYKTWFNAHIDLARILEIGVATFIDRMGSGGYSVGFYIQYQLRDGPVWYEFPGEGRSPSRHDSIPNPHDYPVWDQPYVYASPEHKAWCEKHMVKWLQDRVDVIIEEWKKCRET